MDVDWTKPIEAVYNNDAFVGPAEVVEQTDSMGSSIFVNGYRTRVKFAQTEDWASDNGGLHLTRNWRIRNVQPAAAKPSGISPELADRMAQHLRGMAAQYDEGNHDVDYAFAKELVAELPEPVDADLLEARKLAASFSDREDVSHADYLNGDLDSGEGVQGFLAAIKRGRALEREGK